MNYFNKTYKTRGLTQGVTKHINTQLEDVSIILRIDEVGSFITIRSEDKKIDISANFNEVLKDLIKE